MTETDEDEEIDIVFTDVLVERFRADYEKINKIMLEENSLVKEWTLLSEVYIYGDLGDLDLRVYFYSNKDVGIVGCSCTNMDPQMNQEIAMFVQYIQEKGWNTPIVSDDLVKTNRNFWGYFYLSNLVTGNYLQKNIIKN